MSGSISRAIAVLAVVVTAGALGGCGSSNKEGADQMGGTGAINRVGSTTCTNTCHAASQDISGNDIAAVWRNSTHTTVQDVDCEDCHGPGGQHWGIGPMPFPVPQAERCAQTSCHASFLPAFNETAHANADERPDKFFFQGSASGEQSTSRGVGEVTPEGQPVSKAQHIQECSVCHNPNQRFVSYSSNLVRPSQAQLASQQTTEGQFEFPNPEVSCAGCHDAHQAQQMVTIPQRSEPVGYSIYRTYNVEENGAIDPDGEGTRVTGTIFQPNGVATGGTLSGTNNEINPERLCSACHTVGRYLFSNLSTHQSNVYPQWTNSGHANRNAPAWAEFSANPAAYTNPATGAPYDALDHQTTYPYDMALSRVGVSASTTQNQGINNFACFKCHNGIGSIAYMENVQGTSQAPVIFGDATATCITCHDPHQQDAGVTSNLRRPVLMTNYSSAHVKVSGNVFLDGKPVPESAGDTAICIFCHQGRESGLTLFRSRLAPGKTANGRFFNPHYLGTAAMLWGANGYEYTGKSYSVNAAHQTANCNGCHMENETEDAQFGGHSWNANVASCNTSACHGGGAAPAVAAETDSLAPDVADYRMTSDTNDYDGNGTVDPIAVEITALENRLIALLAANGIYFNDVSYPYFFNAPFPSTTGFENWGTATGGTSAFKAAFNLQFVVKGLPSRGTSETTAVNAAGLTVPSTSQTLEPNISAAVHDYLYIIQLLRDSYEDYNAVAPNKLAALAGVRPEGTRPATVYGTNQ